MKSRIKWYFLRKRTLFSYRISDISVVSSQNQLQNARQHRGSYDRRFAGQQEWNRAARWIDCDGRSVWRDNAPHWLPGDASETKKICSPAARCTVRSSGVFSVARWAGNIRGKASAQVPRVRVMLRLFSLPTRRCTISPRRTCPSDASNCGLKVFYINYLLLLIERVLSYQSEGHSSCIRHPFVQSSILIFILKIVV